MTSERDFWNLVEDIDSQGHELTDWEVDFIDSLLIKRPVHLSAAQKDKIEQIHEERVL